MDYATRYPEAVPLASIDTETVAEALVSIFSHVGISNEVLTDMGTQYTSANVSYLQIGQNGNEALMERRPTELCRKTVNMFRKVIFCNISDECKPSPDDFDKKRCASMDF